MGADFVQFSLTPILIGALAAIACALPGNFLVLRRQALVGDSISHVVLPGIVVGFLLSGHTSTWPMILGAFTAAMISAFLIEVIRRVGRIEAGAAMGVVFTTMFALGVVILERSQAGGVHLDVEHALMGNLEQLIWLRAEGWASLLDPTALAALPEELPRIAVVAMLIAILTLLFWRWLKITTFDEPFALALGLPVQFIGFGLVAMAALAAVAAFEAVGSIIVIAMFICPPATARLLTQSLQHQMWLSVLIAAASAIGGYVLAGYGPIWLGQNYSLSAAGMIATVSGLLLALASMFGRHRKRSSAS